MKRHVLPALAALVVFGLSVAAFAAPKEKTYNGEIMDSQCAMNGSQRACEPCRRPVLQGADVVGDGKRKL